MFIVVVVTLCVLFLPKISWQLIQILIQDLQTSPSCNYLDCSDQPLDRGSIYAPFRCVLCPLSFLFYSGLSRQQMQRRQAAETFVDPWFLDPCYYRRESECTFIITPAVHGIEASFRPLPITTLLQLESEE